MFVANTLLNGARKAKNIKLSICKV